MAVKELMNPAEQFNNTHWCSYSWVEKGIMRLYCVKEANTLTQSDIKPRPLKPQSIALTVKTSAHSIVTNFVILLKQCSFTINNDFSLIFDNMHA